MGQQMGNMLSMASAGMSLYSGYLQSSAIQQDARDVYAAAESNALAHERAGYREEDRLRKRNRHEIARQRAVIGGSGVQLSGTLLMAWAANASELEEDAVNARIAGLDAARAERMNVAAYVSSAGDRAGAAMLTGAIGAFGGIGASLLSGRKIPPEKTPTSPPTSIPWEFR